MTRPKILLLIKSLGLGGAERLLVDSLPFLDRDRFDYQIAYIVPWKNLLAAEVAAAGLPVYCLGDGDALPDVSALGGEPAGRNAFTAPQPLRAAFLLPMGYRRLARLHKEQRFDLVHADLPTSGFLARTLGHRSTLPILYTEHNLQERYHPATRLTNRLTYGWNDHVFAVSDEVAASIRRNGLDRSTAVSILLNGVPVEQVQAEVKNLETLAAELALPPGRPVVGSVAVFRRQKRLVDWVEMAAQVARQRADVLFLLAGDGPEMAAVQARVETLGLRERFRLPGFREDGRCLLGLMDIYVMSSEHEGLPITLLEAMALAKPVVSTRVGGVPEVVQEGVQGFLTPIGAPDELANAVLRLLADPGLAKAMGQAGEERVVDAFHLRRRVAAIEAMYDQMLATKS